MRAIEKRLRGRIKELEQELDKVKKDREQHRTNLVSVFKSAVEIASKGNTWNMLNMIEVLTKKFGNVERWYW